MVDVLIEIEQPAQSEAQSAWTGHDWHDDRAFVVSGSDGEWIPLRQIDDKNFRLPDGVTITYTRRTGLEGKVSDEDIARIRTIHGSEVGEFDLASVPGPLRWFVNSYGVHTPAAIFHDHLIPPRGVEPVIAEVYADRYFRYQLGAVGVPRLKRYVMWTATAMRTRCVAGGRRLVSVLLWGLLAAAGLVAFAAALADSFWGTGSFLPWWSSQAWLWISGLAPLAASSLWGRQFGAGIVASITAIWLVPPAVLAVAGWLVYRLCEVLGDVLAGTVKRI